MLVFKFHKAINGFWPKIRVLIKDFQPLAPRISIAALPDQNLHQNQCSANTGAVVIQRLFGKLLSAPAVILHKGLFRQLTGKISKVLEHPGVCIIFGQGSSYTCSLAPLPLLLIKLDEDRKSTRLNSSHVRISYAVFCLK